MDVPETLYARRDGISIAYQVIGSGPVDLVYVPGLISHVDLQWTEPTMARWLERLASFSRLIVYDKPGTGCSDPVGEAQTLEDRMEDVRAVMDAAGSERAALLGFSHGAALALLFAATYPERAVSVVTFGALVRGGPPEDVTPGMRRRYDEAWATLADLSSHWGEGRIVDLFMPSRKDSRAFRRFTAIMERAAASPGMVEVIVKAAQRYDVLPALSAVSAPVLAIHRSGEYVPVEQSRALVERVPDGRLLEVPGIDHTPWTENMDVVASAIEEFLTGTRSAVTTNRVLATILFTDVVGSTELATRVGDSAWRELLERHDAALTEEVARHGGRIVKTTGDGAFATFSGPARAIACARQAIDRMREMGLDIRAGVHTGECEVRGDDLAGVAVHIGARVGALARPGEVLVSSTVRDLVVGADLAFADRGAHELKGVPGTWHLFAVTEPAAGESSERLPVPQDGAALSLRPGDRATIGLARRAPRMARLAARMVTGPARRAKDEAQPSG